MAESCMYGEQHDGVTGSWHMGAAAWELCALRLRAWELHGWEVQANFRACTLCGQGQPHT
eukprot:365987-Chlamydomonas_euryale.AAC.4